MAKNQSKHHSREFRDYVAKHVIQDGRKISEVADYLNVPYGTLKRWVGEIRAEQKKKEAERQSKLLSATECAEALAQERREKEELLEEVQILKKAMHIFTQEKE